ncbi:MAG: hypothetical protein MJY67_06425 [Bacteroidales bacterium]|nr:hypothetical protein [Bacteroidales bacterium]
MADNYLERQRENFEKRQAQIQKKKSEHRREVMEAYKKKLAEKKKNE